MKWVKTAIGAVIAILSVGIIAKSVYSMTQETVKEEVIASFELLDENDVTDGTYSKLSNFIDDSAIDIVIIFNDITVTNGRLVPYETPFRQGIQSDSLRPYIYIYDDDTWAEYGPGGTGVYEIGDTFVIMYEVTQPAQLSGVTATLILIAPLILAGGLLAYLLNKQELLEGR